MKVLERGTDIKINYTSAQKILQVTVKNVKTFILLCFFLFIHILTDTLTIETFALFHFSSFKSFTNYGIINFVPSSLTF